MVINEERPLLPETARKYAITDFTLPRKIMGSLKYLIRPGSPNASNRIALLSIRIDLIMNYLDSNSAYNFLSVFRPLTDFRIGERKVPNQYFMDYSSVKARLEREIHSPAPSSMSNVEISPVSSEEVALEVESIVAPRPTTPPSRCHGVLLSISILAAMLCVLFLYLKNML